MDSKAQKLAELPQQNSIQHPQTYDSQPPPPYSLEAPSSQPNERFLQPQQPTHLRQLPTRTASSSTLRKPVAIPATDPKVGSPFLRAYPPSLETYALPQEVFLRFLDDLNRIAVASPPLQVLGLAGNIVSFVPLQTAQIVGGAVNAAANIGTVAVSKGRTEIFLRQANKDIFGPRGLKAEISKIDALAKLASMPILNVDGQLDKNAPLLEPIEDLEASRNMTGQERRLKALEPWIAHLDLTPLPDIDVPTNPLSKLSVAASERQRKKGEAKMLKSREKAHEDYNKDARKAEKDYQKEMEKLEKDIRKAHKEDKPRKVEEELAKVERKREKIERDYEEEMSKLGKDRMKDDKEEKGMRKILWLIIRNSDDDSGTGPDPYTEYDGRRAELPS